MKIFVQTLLTYDTTAFLLCNRAHQYRAITRISRAVSRTGDGPMYVVIGLLALALEGAAAMDFFIVGLLAYGIEVPAYIGLKHLFKRSRPFDALHNIQTAIVPADTFSLPSGHTAAAFVMATLLAYFYPIYAPVAYTWAILIGISRVMLGVHYPTDILAGAVLGTLSSVIVISLY